MTLSTTQRERTGTLHAKTSPAESLPGPGRCSLLAGTPLWLLTAGFHQRPSGGSAETSSIFSTEAQRLSFLNSGLKMLFLFSQHFQGSPAKIPSSSQSLTSWMSAALILSTAARVENQHTPLLSHHSDYWCKAATLLQCSEHQSLTHHGTSPVIIHCTDPH